MSKERAIQLRLEGNSRSQIAHALGLKSGGEALSRWLRGVPAPEWTARPNAKDDLRERAVSLRRRGRSYSEILEQVPVSKSTLSLWLALIGVDDDRITYRVHIHEAGDTRRALQYWASAVGVAASSFHRTSLKRHAQRAVRRLPLQDYYGCLRIDVRRSTELMRQIEGWWQGLVAAAVSVESRSGVV